MCLFNVQLDCGGAEENPGVTVAGQQDRHFSRRSVFRYMESGAQVSVRTSDSTRPSYSTSSVTVSSAQESLLFQVHCLQHRLGDENKANLVYTVQLPSN